MGITAAPVIATGMVFGGYALAPEIMPSISRTAIKNISSLSNMMHGDGESIACAALNEVSCPSGGIGDAYGTATVVTLAAAGIAVLFESTWS